MKGEFLMDKPYQAMPDIEVLPAHFPIPGMGLLPVNAFVIKSKEPVLVDTGMGIDSERFLKALESIIDPQELKWVWLTHDDADHTGSLRKVLEAAPGARFVANALAVLRLNSVWQVPMDRVYWLNPGGSIDVGDRKLTAIRPPLFDNPSAIGIYDNKSEVFFSVDCFGGIFPSPAQNADDIAERELAQGMITWATADSPWVHMVKIGEFNQALDKIRKIGPKMILSSHLPLARGRTEQFLEWLAKVPSATPFVSPDQTALEQILAQMKGGT
jgi:flavorubredoxin